MSGEWEVVDLVRGLPRSEENHSVNGLLVSDDAYQASPQCRWVHQQRCAVQFFSYTNEYALSGATLELDLTALNALPTLTDPEGGQGNTPRGYKYDLPTLDDPNIANVTDGVGEDEFGMDENGPHGGNDGLNMAILPADAPLRLYAEGFAQRLRPRTRRERSDLHGRQRLQRQSGRRAEHRKWRR